MNHKDVFYFLQHHTSFNTDEIISVKKIGGLSNNNFKVSFKSFSELFVRMCSNLYIHTDRQNELNIINLASKIKLTPKPYYFSIENGNMILPWINGRLPLESDFSNDDFMKKLARNLKKLHNLNCKQTFNPFEHIRMQINLCKDQKLCLPSYFHILIKKLNILESRLNNNTTIGLCHNDFNYSNMIISDNDLYFIDFEYSAMCDIFWDLATLSWFLNTDDRKRLLHNYFGYYKEEDLKKLIDYLYVVKLSNALWSLLKSTDCSSDYDYLKGALLIFEELINR